MEPAADVPRSLVVWNGVRVTLPDGWQLATIESRYLLLAYDGIAALELKWQPVAASMPLESAQNSLRKQLRKMDGFSEFADSVDPAWLTMLRGVAETFSVSGFALADSNGALCTHEAGRTILMLRLLLPVERLSGSFLQDLLAGLDIETDDSPVRIRIFGFACQLPAGAMLTEHEFTPGLFALYFAYDEMLIRIERHSPANVVLQGSPFRRWIEERLNVPVTSISKDKTAPPCGAYKWYTWAAAVQPGYAERVPFFRTLRRVFPKKRKRFSCNSGAAWVVESENKLITVCISSAQPVESGLIDSIAHHVEILEG